MTQEYKQQDLPYANALMNATECLKYEQACILNEVIQTRNKEEVVDQNLQCIQCMLQFMCFIIFVINAFSAYAFSVLMLLVGWQEEHLARVTRCLRGYLSGAKCK